MRLIRSMKKEYLSYFYISMRKLYILLKHVYVHLMKIYHVYITQTSKYEWSFNKL